MNLIEIARAVAASNVAPQPAPGHAVISYRSTATPAQAEELRQLVDVFLTDDAEAERTDAMTAALAEPDSALTSFRILAAERIERDECASPTRQGVCVLTAEDDRRRCMDCSHLAKHDHRCLAAWRGERIGNAGRNYHPVIDLLGRCEHFKPTMDDEDQRTGAQWWPSLVTSAENQREGGV